MSDDRARDILEAAILVTREHGLAGLSRPRLAERLGCSPALITHYWGPMSALVDAVVQEALTREDLAVLAWAMMENHPIALAASDGLRERAALSIVGK